MSNPQGTHKSKDIYVTNLRANATTIDVQNPPEIKSAAGQLRFEAGVRIGGSSTAATNTTDVAIGKSASATGGNSISINGTSTGAISVAIGKSTVAKTRDVVMGSYSGLATTGGSYNTFIGQNNFKNFANTSNSTNRNIAIGDDNALNFSAAYGFNNNIIIGSSNMKAGSALTDLFRYNVAIGRNNMYRASTTTGRTNLNVAIGDRNLVYASGAAVNVAIGELALYYNTSGDFNIAIGESPLFHNTTGSNNIAFGLSALFKNTTGYDNIVLGRYAAYQNTFGYRNIAIGYYSLYKNTSGYQNIAIGSYALWKNTTGSESVAIGYRALSKNTTGTLNFAIGRFAGYNSTTASYITAVGHRALGQNTSAYNTALGFYAASLNTTGIRNTAIGYRALERTFTGSDNTAVGHKAGGQGGTMGSTASKMTLVGSFSDAVITVNEGVAIGWSANVATSGSVQIGQAVKYSGGNAIMSFRSQTVSDEAWIDTQIGYAKIDGSGNLYKDTTPITSGNASIFRRNRTTTQTIATDTDTTIQFNANDANNTSPPGTWNGTLYQFEVNANGWYEITGGVEYSTDINNKYRVDILINGSVEAGQTQLYTTGTIASSTTVVKAYISSGGAIKVNTTQNTGSSKDLQSAFIIVEKIAGTLSLPTFVSLATANLDMACYTISNVMAMHVGNLYGKSPIDVHDNFNIKDTVSGGKITFESGIEIGDSSTSTANNNSIAIGKQATANTFATAIGSLATASLGYSIAVGNRAQSSNVYSIAIGSGYSNSFSPRSLAYASVAIGTRSYTNPAGFGSVALGFRARCLAGYSGLALGYRSESQNIYGVAVGAKSNALAKGSVAIGGLSDAGSLYGVTVGYSTNNSGIHSISIGSLNNTGATSPNSVSIGHNIGSYGTRSILIGNATSSTISATDAIAIGTGATVTQQDQIRFGNPIPTSATATATAWGQTFSSRAWVGGGLTEAAIDNDGNIIRSNISGGGWVGTATSNLNMDCYNISNVMAMFVGNLYGKSPIDVHDNFNIKNTVSGGKITFEAGIEIGNTTTSATNIGGIAIALGHGATASGNVSIAIGSNAIGSNVRSIAIGTGAHAYGRYDVAINAKASSVGPQNDPNGGAVAIGCMYAEGSVDYAEANYYGATAIGARAKATKKYAVAISGRAHAYGDYSIAIGSQATAPNYTSIAIGKWARAEDDAAIAVGYHAWCLNAYQGIAIGKDSYTYANADYGITIGKNALVKTSSTRGISIGRSAEVYASSADGVAIGSYAKASYNGVAIGHSTTVQPRGVAIGWSANGSGQYSIAIGKSAAAYARTLALGSFAETTNNYAIALGSGPSAGNGAKALAQYAISIGTKSSATSTNSTAIGGNAHATANGSIAIGKLSNASGLNSVALGYSASTSSADDVQLGRNTGSGGAGVMKFHSQTVSSEAWVAAGVKMAVIDASGNMNKDSASTVTLTGTLSIGTNLIVSTITPLTANKVTISGNVEVTGTSFQVGKSSLVTKQTTTTNATPSNVTIIALPTTANYAHFDVFVSAISSSLVVASYNFRDGFVRSNGVTASLINPTKTVLYEANAAYDASVTVSGTNVIITITGIAATTVTWDIITNLYSKNL